jgi:hypothetical protein
MVWQPFVSSQLNFVTRLYLFYCFLYRNFAASVRFEVFTAVKIQSDVFWVVTLCGVAVGYKRFGGPSCLHLVKMEAGRPWSQYGVATQKTTA